MGYLHAGQEKRLKNCASVSAMKTTIVKTPCLHAIANADEILAKSETAKRLKISKRTLDQWMRVGRVPFLKIGRTVRFRWSDVLAQLGQKCRIN